MGNTRRLADEALLFNARTVEREDAILRCVRALVADHEAMAARLAALEAARRVAAPVPATACDERCVGTCDAHYEASGGVHYNTIRHARRPVCREWYCSVHGPAHKPAPAPKFALTEEERGALEWTRENYPITARALTRAIEALRAAGLAE